jgi:hypothetical protein
MKGLVDFFHMTVHLSQQAPDRKDKHCYTEICTVQGKDEPPIPAIYSSYAETKLHQMIPPSSSTKFEFSYFTYAESLKLYSNIRAINIKNT